MSLLKTQVENFCGYGDKKAPLLPEVLAGCLMSDKQMMR